MILLLTDETWEQVRREISPELLLKLTTKPSLPSDRELVALARSGADAPDAITQCRARRDAAIEAQVATRESMNRLVRHVRGAGVSGTVIARWFGLKSSRVYEILGSE